MSGDNNNLNLPELNPEEFGYLSARDINADGTHDLIHGVDHDGNAHVFHLDGKGDITLEEIDTDGDGTFETQREMVDSSTVAYTVDTDNDGAADTVAYVDAKTNTTFQQDFIEDGQVVESRVDLDGDGITDVVYKDTTGDGYVNEISLDTDGDGFANTKLVDRDGDGNIDEIHSDLDNSDGILETVIEAGDYAGGLGSINDYLGTQDASGSLDNTLDTDLNNPADNLDTDYNDSF